MRNKIITSTVWEDDSMDPTGWWMSEKYDGMRLFWNGAAFFTRQGRKLKVPLSIVSQMPNISLDGELWTQYGLVQEPIQLSRTLDTNKWRKAIFWIFDAPDIAHQPYEERLQYLKNLQKSETLPKFVKIIDTVKCEGKEHLHRYLVEVVAKGGEGVMLREPGSLYRGGRSPSLRKFKEYLDTEVKVIQNNYPYGFNCVQ